MTIGLIVIIILIIENSNVIIALDKDIVNLIKAFKSKSSEHKKLNFKICIELGFICYI